AQTVSEQIIWFPPLSGNLFSTLMLAAVAGTAGRLLRIPSGVMLLPMLVGAMLNASGVMVIELPEWLLAIAYMSIGWQIGLGFDKQIFLMALRPLPQILLSIFSLMAICAAMAWGLAHYMQIDFLTAYLATSPGGVDSVAVIAAGSHADMALIMTMQTLRLFSILLTGPAVARFISVHAPKQPA
ncbi:MAG: AbrB family transcriptional regulator, partial [Gammaproteobacteria bacterium]|nr:AbrB family transcriptional regulator [Gammaproteobacteria bacterium]